MQQLILAGSGRSGTTWISDVLASCRGCCSVYEPLRACMVAEVPTSQLPGEHPATYLHANEDNPQWQNYFRNLFDGKISNCWTRQEWRNDGRRLWPRRLAAKTAFLKSRLARLAATHCVIKEIRANLLLDWISRRFPVRVIYLTRHPCAVVGSRLRLKWSDVLSELLAQQRLVDDFLAPYIPTIENATTPLQRMTVHWCIENLVPLSQLADHPDWIPLNYETCVARGAGEFANLFQSLGLSPSSATAGLTKTRPATSDASWHHPLTLSEGEEVLDICRAFGITCYGREFLPLREQRAAMY